MQNVTQNSARDALDDASVESKEELSCTLGYLDALEKLADDGSSQVIALFRPSFILVLFLTRPHRLDRHLVVLVHAVLLHTPTITAKQ